MGQYQRNTLSDLKREPDARRQVVASRRMRRIIFLVALAALAMAILLAFVAEALDVFDYWSPPDD
jgi:uncharacterized protein involved in exopolysaccharide biosynthesis